MRRTAPGPGLKAPVLAAALAAAVALLPAPSWAAGVFEANHPLVKRGNEAYAKGEYEEALKAYEQAERELPDSPELQYNLGDAYMKLKRADEAKRAYEAALKKAPDSLKARDYFNLGNAFVEMNQKDEAVSAYRQALKVDPKNEPARRNLELLLRNKNEQKNPSPVQGDGGTPPDGGRDAGAPDSGGQDGGQSKDNPDAGQENPDGGSDAGSGDGGATDGGASDGGGDGGRGDGGGQGDGGSQGDGGRQDGGSDGGGKGEDDSERPDGGSEDAGQQDGGTPPPSAEPEKPKNLDKQEAERLLDAIRRNEKQFLMQQHKKAKQRARPEKDW